ncbi:MAG: lytic transglycosylase F, partial [Idiomarina sp.]
MLFSACSPQQKPDQLTVVKERQVLRVGTLMNPTSYYFDHDREQGFEYDLAKRFAARMGVELQMVPRFDVNDLFTLLRRGDVDLVAAGLDRT